MQVIPTRIEGVEIIRYDSEYSPFGLGDSKIARGFQDAHGLTRQPRLAPESYGQRVVRCFEGELFVVAVDVHPDSSTFGQWQCFYLRGGDQRAVAIAPGIALGWQIVSDDCRLSVSRQCSRMPATKRTSFSLHWDDPELAIAWPVKPNGFVGSQLNTYDLAKIPSCPPVKKRFHLLKPPLKVGEADQENSKQPGQETNPQAVSEAPQRLGAAKFVKSATIQPDVRPILVIGSSGQLGRDLCRHLRSVAPVIGACRYPGKQDVLPVPTQVDVSRPACIREAIRRVQPQLIVNATGIRTVEHAEREPRVAQLVNATAPTIIAEEALRIGAGVLHFCSDQVFDGSGERPWSERDEPRPLNQYGRTKLLGTQAIQASGAPHLIVRTGWLYSTHSDNYVRTIMDLCTYRNSLTLAADHFGSPTSTDWLARTISQLLGERQSRAASGSQLGEHFRNRPVPTILDWLRENGGLYHLTAKGFANRVGVGDQVVATCRQHAVPVVLSKLHAAKLDELPSSRILPKNCRLDSTTMAVKFGLDIPRWQEELQRQIAAILIGIPAGTVCVA
ncbi:MAG: sugar nucleotide-binding protein [Planctomycetales bacterium]|nr:sugar nucleotide-binding protein [Planctomycetales bacterium]